MQPSYSVGVRGEPYNRQADRQTAPVVVVLVVVAQTTYLTLPVSYSYFTDFPASRADASNTYPLTFMQPTQLESGSSNSLV